MSPDLEVNGWIKKVAVADVEVDFATQINHDTFTQIYFSLVNNLDDTELKEKWNNFLKALNAEQLNEVPLVGSVSVIEDN